MSTPHTIVLKGHGRHEERQASGILKPGHLVMFDSNDQAKVHNELGGAGEVMFAKEQASLGFTINDAFAVGDLVPVIYPLPGDVVYARVPANAPAISEDDELMSAGNGCLIKASSEQQARLFTNSAIGALQVAATTGVEVLDSGTGTIPANILRVGSMIRIRASVLVPAATNSTSTITVSIKIGSVVVATSVAADAAAGDVCNIDLLIHIRSIGASGTMVGTGTVNFGSANASTVSTVYLASTVIDTTVAQTVTVNQQYSATNAANASRVTDFWATLGQNNPMHAMMVAAESIDNSASASEAFIRARRL